MFPWKGNTYYSRYVFHWLGRETHITSDMCVSRVGEHSGDMCFLGRGTHTLYITRDICFLGGGTHTCISRDMCFPCRGTNITRDMGFLCRGTHITSYKMLELNSFFNSQLSHGDDLGTSSEYGYRF